MEGKKRLTKIVHPSPLCLHRRELDISGTRVRVPFFFLFFHRLFIEGIRRSATVTFYLGIIRFYRLKKKKKETGIRYIEYFKARRKNNPENLKEIIFSTLKFSSISSAKGSGVPWPNKRNVQF